MDASYRYLIWNFTYFGEGLPQRQATLASLGIGISTGRVLTMSVKSSATVFRVLRHLAAETRPVSGGDVARDLGVPVTNAARALATLEAAGYAERHHGSAGFVIGKSARTLAFAFMAQFPVRDLAMPYLQQLTLETGLTSSLFIRLGWYAVRIGQIIGPSVLIHPTRLGELFPLTTGAPSLAILGHLPEAEVERAGARAARNRTPSRRHERRFAPRVSLLRRAWRSPTCSTWRRRC